MGGQGAVGGGGALLGGLFLGFAEVLSVAYVGSNMRDAVAFGLLFLVLLVRPKGLNLVLSLGINGLLALSIWLTLACGMLALANAAFMGIGAYTASMPMMDAGARACRARAGAGQAERPSSAALPSAST
eukprot:gene39534-52130_t